MADEPAPSSPTPPPAAPKRKTLFRMIRIVVLAYLGLIVVVFLIENRLVFQPGGLTPVSSAIEHKFVRYTTSDGVELTSLYLPCPEPFEPVFGSGRARPVLLYFHGNAGDAAARSFEAVQWHRALGADVLLAEYRGYGINGGAASEAGVYRDAQAAYDWLTKTNGVDPSRVILAGESLGGAVAVELAAKVPCRAVVLERTFTSLPDVAFAHFPFLPTRWIMRNRMNSRKRIGSLDRPVFIAHGDQDEVVPFRLGRRLFEAAGEPKRFLAMPGVSHNVPMPAEYYLAVRRFLIEQAR